MGLSPGKPLKIGGGIFTLGWGGGTLGPGGGSATAAAFMACTNCAKRVAPLGAPGLPGPPMGGGEGGGVGAPGPPPPAPTPAPAPPGGGGGAAIMNTQLSGLSN